MKFCVYILRTNKNTLYIGQTSNLEKRLEEHRNKKVGAKYMRYFSGFELVYSEKFSTRSAAMKREVELKKLSKAKKEWLIHSV